MEIPESLRASWRTTAVLSCCAIVGANLFLVLQWHVPFDWRRFALPLLTLAYVLAIYHNGLQLNRRPGETRILERPGAANTITMVRGTLVAFLTGFIIWPAAVPFLTQHPLAWLPGTIYIAAALLDAVDGFLARRSGCITRLGEMLDIRIDALGLMLASLVGIILGRLPLVYLSVGLAYYGFRTGIWYRRRQAKPVKVLLHRPEARLAAGFNMGLVGAALLPVFQSAATTIAAMVFMLPLTAGFLRDWLVVSGRMQTNGRQRTPWEHAWLRLSRCWLPVLLRMILFVGGLAASEELAATLDGTTGGTFGTLIRPFFLLAVTLLAIGALGRTAALFILLLSAHWIGLSAGDLLPRLLLIGASMILLLGCGCLSLWQPEEKLLSKKV